VLLQFHPIHLRPLSKITFNKLLLFPNILGRLPIRRTVSGLRRKDKRNVRFAEFFLIFGPTVLLLREFEASSEITRYAITRHAIVKYAIVKYAIVKYAIVKHAIVKYAIARRTRVQKPLIEQII
jgi:hypothetical protein